MSEREVEVPFTLKHAKGPDILDVGVNENGLNDYSEELTNKWKVETVDPNKRATYGMKFELLDIDKKYDTIIFVSSLEHFNPTEENRESCATEILCIRKALEMLKEDGRIILTVPMGKSGVFDEDGYSRDVKANTWVPNGFIIYPRAKINKIMLESGAWPYIEEVHRFFVDGGWKEVINADDAQYMGGGASNAEAVYMGVWTK